MRTRSSSHLNNNSSKILRRNRRHSQQQQVEPDIQTFVEPSVVAMVDQRTMALLLQAPTENYEDAIVVPKIVVDNFELKQRLLMLVQNKQFFGHDKEDPHAHILYFNKITSTMRFPVSNMSIKLMLFPFSLEGATRIWLEKEPPLSILTWEDLVSKFINEFFPPFKTTNLRNEITNFRQRFDESFSEAWDRFKYLLRACPHHEFSELHQLDTFYNALNANDQDSLNSAAGGNFLDKRPQDCLIIIESKSKVRCSRNRDIVSKTSLSNQTNEIKNMMASLLQINTASTSGSGSLPSNTIANPKGELKAITTRSGLVIDGPTIPTPSRSINPEEDEHVEEPFTDPDLDECTIKQEIYEVQIYKFWQMFKQLHINITLADALILMPKYQKMLKALMSNKEKLQELENTPLNENFSAVILKMLLEKHGDPGKFLIPCGFSELKCKALADLGASINLMPLSVYKKLGLPELIPTRMTLELANRAICTPAGIARDVFIPVGKFTFPANFVIVDCETDPRVPLILGRPFLRTARALIDFHDKEMILRDGDERLTLNMRHDTSSYGNPTFSPHPELTSPEVNNDIFDSKGCNVLSEKLLDLDSIKDLHPPLHDNQLSGNTTYPLLEEFADELPPEYDDNFQFDIESDLKEIEFLLYQDKDSSLNDSIDQKNRANLDDIFVDSIPEMFTDEHTLDYSSPLIFDVYDDDFLEVESDTGNVYDDPFDSKGEKIKESKLLIDELDLSCDFLPPSEYDSFISQEFSRLSSIPENLKTLAKGFCTQVFISSASFWESRIQI
nr:reverse transcriptase domain-containing protein [Tanacetum cinerariifolium]